MQPAQQEGQVTIEENHDHDGDGRPVIYVVGWSWTNSEPNLPASDWNVLGASSERPVADALAEEIREREHAAYLAEGHAAADDEPCACGPEVLAVPLVMPEIVPVAPAPGGGWVN